MKLLRILGIVLLMVGSSSAEAQEEEIAAVISGQLVALAESDFGTAYKFASPSVQAQVPTTEDFAAMVKGSFPMMLAVRDVDFVDFYPTQQSILQRVKITNEDGTNYWFAYEMIVVNGAWRINGVSRLRPPGAMT
jgi:hypothetical protein